MIANADLRIFPHKRAAAAAAAHLHGHIARAMQSVRFGWLVQAYPLKGNLGLPLYLRTDGSVR